jgi:MoaA/NifB/PqqE/SkfB family radical SAM enzyme
VRGSETAKLMINRKDSSYPGRAGYRQTVGKRVGQLVARTTEMVMPAIVIRRRERRDWQRWVRSLTPELLTELTSADSELKRKVFKANVTRVEIETHAKCNRVCSFCPNSTVDRRTNSAVADAGMLDRMFDDLGSIDYDGQICVARYSEPLTNRQYLYERLASARARAPRAALAITTNTDYLTAPILRQLRDVGLNVMYMSLYLKNNERWSIELARAYSDRLSKKLAIRMLTRRETETSVQCTYEFPGLEISSTCHNWDEYGIDRGGLIQIYGNRERLGPCRDPFQTFVVDYNGTVTPCCCVRSDLPGHRDFLMGDLSRPDVSIFDIYAGRLARWRRGVVSFGTKASPCTTCRHRDIARELVNPLEALLEKQLDTIGHSELCQNSAVTPP